MAPNTLRGFDTPARSWLATGEVARARSRAGAPAAPRARARQRPAFGPRLVARIGLLLAAAGVLPFLNEDFRWEQLGLGMMCTGIGMVLLAASPGILRSHGAAARRSGISALAVLLTAPHWIAVPVIGGGLLLAGLSLLADAVTRG